MMNSPLSALDRPELEVFGLLVPWVMVIGAIGFLAAWLILTLLEITGWSRYVWHLPIFFLALVVLFSCLIGMVFSP
jgi:amino acid transporter